MKTKKKINFMGYYQNFDYHDYLPFKILDKNYDVQIVNNPDYIFCNIFNNYDYCNFKGIRIYGGNEYFTPDFNIFDYAISYDDIQFGDRYLSFPFVFNMKGMDQLSKRSSQFRKDEMEGKTKFCNYIYSHIGCKERHDIFKVISNYKKVDSAGKYLNNMGGKTPGDRGSVSGLSNSIKIEFQKNYKFSIAFENFSFPGYVTEKLFHGFYARTIPIYYGDPKIGSLINNRAFINCHDFNTFEDVLAKIIEIDNNNDLFIDMVNQPIFINQNFIEEKYDEVEKFVIKIFEQDIDEAYRRPNVYRPKQHEENLILLDKILRGRKQAEFYEKIINKLKCKFLS